MAVNVSLYFASGWEYYLEPIVLGPRQTISINLNRVVESLPLSARQRASQEGTAEVEFNGPNNAALMGSISVTNPERGIGWTFRLYPVKPTLPVVPLQGLFWFHDDRTDGFVAAQNASEEVIAVTPHFRIASQDYPLPLVSLAPGQGLKLELRKELQRIGLKNTTAGGIEFVYEGPSDALKAHGVLFNSRGFSAEIDFTRLDSWLDPRKIALRTPRFAVGRADPDLGLAAQTIFDPTLALHNFASSALSITLSVGYVAGGAPKELKLPVSLPPGETQVLPLSPLLEGAVPEDAHWASLEVSYYAAHTSLAASLVSVTRNGEHSIRSVLNWVYGSASDGWLWRADADHNTLIALMNSDVEEARVAVSLDYYVDGVAHSYELPERTIPRRGSELVDVGQIVASGIADSDGDIIPAETRSGGYSVRKIGPRIHKTLTTEALVYNRRTKNFLTFYNTCCGPRNVEVIPLLIEGPLGFTSEVNVQGVDSCSGVPVNLDSSSTFFIASTTVATVNGSGLVSSVAPGSTTTRTHLDYLQGPEYVNGSCMPAAVEYDAPTIVQPTVAILGTKNFVFVGSDPTVVSRNSFSASGNPTGGTFAWSANGSGLSFNTSSAANVTITSSATSGSLLDKSITVNYSKNGQNAIPATRSITARLFRFLQQSGQIQVIAINGPPVFGYNATVIYKVYTNPAQQLVAPGVSGISVFETVTIQSITVNGVPAQVEVDLTTATSATNQNSEVVDQLGLTRDGQPLPSGLDITANQDLIVGGFFVRNNTSHFLTNGPTVTNNGPFLTP